MILAPILFMIACSHSAAPRDAWDGVSRVVHEWGTFTSIQGSDGVALDGLCHAERDLPEFVYDAAREHALAGLSPKMETPVLYFYSPERWQLAVHVGFPRGKVTQWFPAASAANDVPESPPWLGQGIAGGWIDWGAHGELTVLPHEAPIHPPPVGDEDPWRFARDVAANPLCVRHAGRKRASGRVGGRAAVEQEHERFLFYRGLGDFALPVSIEVTGEQHERAACRFDLRLANAEPREALTGCFLVCVDGDRAGFLALPDVGASSLAARVTIEMQSIADSTGALCPRVVDALCASGLYRDEALAMARTWASGWFEEPGLRVLYVLPRGFVERELPLELRPGFRYDAVTQEVCAEARPDEVVRTFVARTEILTPARECELVETVRVCAYGNPAERAAALAELERWGRFAPPWLARVRALCDDQVVRACARELAARR